MAIKKLPDNCFFKVYDACDVGGDIKQIRSVSGHYAILELTTGEETYYIAYIDGVNYGWIADPKAFEAKMKAYQLPRKSGTMEIKKTTIWGVTEDHWTFDHVGRHIYEDFLNGVSQGEKSLFEWQQYLFINYNPYGSFTPL